MKKLNYFVIAALFISLFFIVSCNEPSEEEVADQANEIMDALNDAMDDNTATDKFHSEDGKFKVNFSGTPDVTNETIPIEGVGDIEMYMFIYEKSMTEVEMVAYSDYPSDKVKDNNPDEMLHAAKDGAVNNLGATIVEEKEITYKGNKGLEFKANSTQFYVNYKIFLVKNRLYQIAIMRDGSYASQANVDKFFSSFELLD